jgi:hypothetical protein
MAFEDDGRVRVDTSDAHYREVVLQSMPELAADPERFLGELARHFHSDYFFATELHDDDRCPFAHGDQIPFERRGIAHPVGT